MDDSTLMTARDALLIAAAPYLHRLGPALNAYLEAEAEALAASQQEVSELRGLLIRWRASFVHGIKAMGLTKIDASVEAVALINDTNDAIDDPTEPTP